MTPRLLLAVLLAFAAAGSGTASAALYCVERDGDTVAGHQVHGGLSRCVPAP